MGEIDTAIEDGKDLAKKELMPLIEEANRQTEDERRQKEEAKANLKKIIQKLINKGFSLTEIAEDLEKSIQEIQQIIE